MSAQLTGPVVLSIADSGSDPDELAAFFCSNLTDSYISHSELQSLRTTAAGTPIRCRPRLVVLALSGT